MHRTVRKISCITGGVHRRIVLEGLRGEDSIAALCRREGIAGVSREVMDAFSTRRAEIAAAMDGRGLGTPAENQRAAQRAALMTRAAKRDVAISAL